MCSCRHAALQGQTLLREISALQSRLDQERTQRSFVQSAVKDSKDEVSIKLQQQAGRHTLGHCPVQDFVPCGGCQLLLRPSCTIDTTCKIVAPRAAADVLPNRAVTSPGAGAGCSAEAAGDAGDALAAAHAGLDVPDGVGPLRRHQPCSGVEWPRRRLRGSRHRQLPGDAWLALSGR